ncbi:biliverdin-producing heme oxygenase [Cyanobium sp. NIES-981]|uniref:biliverdin-producing heme oxygenase n=1 Tax=Cyanobium sp. NIES-981 TaxID=1851505 RepID=UPI0007DCEE22|nr:biliverdin-producing heme oxygenase [Cyanobium sp. NIES-981]SBO43651.1 Heme oxygenase superfamily [Cyanobium sp. NIES-981]
MPLTRPAADPSAMADPGIPEPGIPERPISNHAIPGGDRGARTLGPRLRRLHARIGRAHHHAEGMRFSRALLAGQADPRQLAALLRALAPAYALLEQEAPPLAASLGATALPWADLARTPALRHDLAQLAVLPATPPSAAAAIWLEQLRGLARQAPHRLMAHVYVRYGGDLSGGQQLAQQAAAILARHQLSTPTFWAFARGIPALKQALHDGIEQLVLTEPQEEELLDEAEQAFVTTQRLLAELADLLPEPPPA